MTKTEGKTRQLIVYLSRSSIIMRCCLFLIPLQPSSPLIMPPYGRVHPPACVIWTFRWVSFACGPRPCLYFQCLFVICPTCIQTNGSFKVSLCLHYVLLPILVLTSHSVHAPTHLDEIDWCWEINCVSSKEIKVWSISLIEMTRGGGVCGDQKEYIVRS